MREKKQTRKKKRGKENMKENVNFRLLKYNFLRNSKLL